MSKTIDVSDLPEPLVMAIESLVNTYRDRSRTNRSAEQRPLGWLKGQMIVPNSFFEPLPDDVLDLFDGGPGRA